MSEPFHRPPYPASSGPRRQLLRLRFDRRDELDFRADYEAGAMDPRLLLLIIALLMVAATPLYDRSLLLMPDAFTPIARSLQFGLEIPAILAAIFVTWNVKWRRWSAPACLLATVAVCTGVAAQRYVGANYGFFVPPVFPALIIAAALTVARLRFFYVVPWMAGVMIITTVLELWRFDAAPAAIYQCIANWMLFALTATGAYLLEHSARWNWYNGRLLEQQAARDALTDLPNRRHFDSMLLRLVREAIRERKNVALLMIDIDDFKAYNDLYGHPAGDECLRRTSRWLADNMRRPQDFCARLGGEEFGAVWFNASTRDAPRLAEELREGIARLAIPHAAARARRVVTASAGFVQLMAPGPEEAAESIAAELIERADRALYEAKRSGRSRMVISGPHPVLKSEASTVELPPEAGAQR